MANSSFSLNSVVDGLVARGMIDPRNLPSGYAETLGLELGNDAMADLISSRFNWKFNRATAKPFPTNSWQQDYPQLAQKAGIIGWGEDCHMVDINNTMIPKPIWPITWRRQLSRVSTQLQPVRSGNWQTSWMYNKNLSFGSWPGPGVVYHALITPGTIQQNPLMSMVDSNANLLILTQIGTTGTTAPAAPADSEEGTTVNDGTCIWTVVSPDSQGFRLWPLANATGPVYLIVPNYQLDPPTIESMTGTLDPIPNSFIRHFRTALRYHFLGASQKPDDKAMFAKEYPIWLENLAKGISQGDREMNVYQLLPASSPVDSVYDYGYGRGTADQPF